MKDTKVAQEIWNLLKRDTYNSITPSDTQFYITDEMYTELPIITGLYSETSPGDNWIETTDSWINSSKWPELWDLLTGIKDGDVYLRDIQVCTSSEFSNIPDTKKPYYFVIDTTNNKFKVPRCLEDSRMVGGTDAPVFASTSNYAGCYMISAKGKYYEYGAVVRLVKATKTVSGQSYTYYKPTQVPSPYTAIDTETINDGRTLTHDILNATIAEELLNNKYICKYFCNNSSGYDSTTELINLEMFRQYPLPPLEQEQTTTGFSFCLPLYDASIDDDSPLIEAIQTNANESYISYSLEGYILPPDLEDYNLSTKLYIKAV